MNRTRKDVLDLVKHLEEAIAKGHEYLECGKNAHWHGFRPFFDSEERGGKLLPPQKDWVKKGFLPRRERALRQAQKVLEKLISPELAAEVSELTSRGLKIVAIKRLRQGTGWGLVDAKMWVDRDLADRGFERSSTGHPCPYCGRPLRTGAAKQCFGCGTDWHDAT